MEDKLTAWACKELSRFGSNCDNKEIVAYLMAIEEEDLLKDYLEAMLDVNNSRQRKFIKDFISKSMEAQSTLTPGFYRKPELEETFLPQSDKGKNKKDRASTKKTSTNQEISDTGTKKKSKYTSLYGEGNSKDVVMLSGRHICNCQASKHKLINNCLKCGRIVCEQEGSGPCAFCKTLVMSKDEREIINRNTKKSEVLHNKLINTKKLYMANKPTEESNLNKAIEHKNKLLEFDKTSEKRTKVYDDENDYFQSNSKWLNPANREKLQKLEVEMKQRKYDRNIKSVTVDLLGRKIVQDTESTIYGYDDPIIKELLEDDTDDIYYNNIESMTALNLSRPVYTSSEMTTTNSTFDKNKQIANGLFRVQDKGLQEMRDDGLCMSMHQPWASLLVAGIKIHEGRTWYSSHKGRLWIASAAKVPTDEEITHLEEMYKKIWNDDTLVFPRNYPTGCLLGCVDVVDVLPQEEYMLQFPNGESDSPYVFVCENPKEMVIKFPIKGEHKIYKIDSKIHSAAKKAIRN